MNIHCRAIEILTYPLIFRMLLALLVILHGVLAGSFEKIPSNVVETLRMGAYNQKFYEITKNHFTSLPTFSSLPAVSSEEHLKEALPVSSLEDVYRRARIKHLSGISFWSTLEKYETCKIISTIALIQFSQQALKLDQA